MGANRPSIACVYCGGSHDDPAEVRSCWQSHQAAPAAATTRDTTPPASATVCRGPRQLGRVALVAPGQIAPVEWEGATVVVDSPPLEFSTGEPAHRLGPRFAFDGEAAAHALATNAVDLRGGSPRWSVVDTAVALGARPVDDGRGDVELPDGTRAWLDGGPPRFIAPIDGIAVIHRVVIEHGSLRPPLGNDTNADLAPDQLAAVTHDTGVARIIAPAGSGKTRVLTERARHLVDRWRIPASAICLVAFNKRAQEEMTARTADVRGLQVRTLNSLALAVINGAPPFAPQPRRLATIDEREVRHLLGGLVSFPRRRNADPVAAWIDALSLARLGLRDPVRVEAMYDGDVEGFADVYPRFRRQLAAEDRVDYDEQILRAVELLLAEPATRAAAQRACRFLLVDEFQDLTPAHLLLVRLLAGPDGAVYAVGDDDQTIYGYNGADPAWLIDFAEIFPGAGDHPLEVNYRCPAGIVRAADTLLRHNRRRVVKTIRPADPSRDGFLVARPSGDSVATTVEAVCTAVAAGLPPGDVAVLTRVNSLLAPVQIALRARGIPTSGGVGSEFLDRTAVRAGLAWLRLATGDQFAADDLAEALRRPSRSLHPRIAEWVTEQRNIDGLLRLADRITTERDATKVGEFAADISRLRRLAGTRGTTTALLGSLRDQMGLATSLAGLDSGRRGMGRTAQGDDLTALAQLAAMHDDPATFERWLRVALGERWDSGGVTLATVHRVKGQEWPLVVVHHADGDQFPHRLADDVEEERRLFHVAITRASRDVVVVPDLRPSPFVDDCVSEPRPRSAAAPAAALTAISRSTPRPTATKPGDHLDAGDRALFEALRELRRHLAAGKPAYTVLPDSSLHAIAVARPASPDELARIKGVGPAKLSLYGTALLAAVAAAGEPTEN